MPKLYIIAGCNGAGKTTASFKILPDILDCKEFVNADSIAAGLSPFNPESVALEAERIMQRRIHQLMEKKMDFAFETTLTTRSHVLIIRKAKAIGYDVSVLYSQLSSPTFVKRMVAKSIRKENHNLPSEVIEQKKTDINELSEKILLGMRIALKELVEKSARNNEKLIIGDKDGNIMAVPAKDLLPSVEK